jgi:hypothetical protein
MRLFESLSLLHAFKVAPINSIKILEDKFTLTNPFENHSENIQKPSP